MVLRDTNLRHTIVEIQKRKASVAGKANRRGADVQLNTASLSVQSLSPVVIGRLTTAETNRRSRPG